MKILKSVKGEDLLYIGREEEEYYFEKNSDGEGWSLMGLRPETEEALRERARDSDPCEYLGISKSDFENIEKYFDFEAFEEDMESDWYDRHDVQVERENEEGETLYLGFGSGQSLKSFFEKNNITNFESYKAYFEEVGLDKNEFNDLFTKFNLK